MDKEIASIIESWRSKKANRVAKRAGRTGRPDKREADANSDADWADVYESIRRQLYKVDVERSRSASRSGSLQPAAEEATGRGASESSFDSVHEVLEGLPSSPTVQEFTSDNSFDFVREYLEGLPSSSLAPATPRDDSFEYVREYLEGMPSSSMAPASPSDGGDEGDEGDEDDEEEAGPNEDEFGDEESGDDDSGDADSWVTPSTPSTTSTPSGCSRSDLIWDHREEKMTPAGAYADLWARYCRETKANKNLQDPETSTANEIPDTTMHASDESTQSLNKKRSLEQLEDGSKKFDTIKPSAREPPSDTAGIKSTTDGEPEKKRHRDNSQEPEPKADNGFASSAFGKAVGASPFASLGNTQESNFVSKTTSPSPFADSSFASYAASVNSPFCPPAASKPSVFMSAPAGSNSFASAPATSGFGGMGGGFAGFSGGFAAAAKPGLTSFASNNAPPTFGETKAKPLGADDSDDDESDGDGDEDGSSTFEAAKTDERFYEQTVETGEEQEETVFTCKAKLFHFSNKEWKERGIGTFKINVRQTADGNEAGRMIMRADGAGRVILNSPIFKGMNYGGPDNSAPASKQILLAGTEEGRTVPLLLRTQSEATAVDLYDVIDDLLADPSTTSANTSTSA
ncbi:uncharacterized protein N7483_003376 [Penicillium malachiteum]|uniref:uncharacterized protein n=1 Tax=Penicillium malachiteum TaxID=1324776 RepID=UPI002548E682|nr:uncharacterized protein N7483_003376 [Penicillium malachiteum]KAJ5728868.1 hypothetical protein N7483_003376 [Penicillium malachiteum]